MRLLVVDGDLIPCCWLIRHVLLQQVVSFQLAPLLQEQNRRIRTQRA